MRTLWAFLMIAGHVFAPWRRGWRVRWGARRDEPDQSLAGERLIGNASWEFTHAVSIAAPREDVWPWIAQLGQGRGGCSFELLENLVGCRITNADAILPEHQTLAVGDEIRLHRNATPLRVAVIDPGRSLVLRGTPTDDPPPGTDSLWTFHLLADGPGTCRLVERGKSIHGNTLTDRLFFSPLLVEPIGFVMSREMLLGIKARAENATTP